MSIGMITGVNGPAKDGPKPQMGPEHTTSLLVEVRTTANPEILELSQAGALELVAALSTALKARGFP